MSEGWKNYSLKHESLPHALLSNTISGAFFAKFSRAFRFCQQITCFSRKKNLFQKLGRSFLQTETSMKELCRRTKN